MRRIAILGGGISGLAAALHLQDAASAGNDLAVTVYERSARAGGCVQTLYEDGYIMELGPDSLLAEKPAARALLRRLGLEDQLVPMREEYRGARIVHNGRLHAIPAEFRLFSPTSLPALLKSGIFSAKGIARAALEPFIPARKSNDDESLASFITRRFGREVLDRLAQPLIGGIYSGDPRRLSMQSALPQFLEFERRYGSVMRGMAAARASGATHSAPQLMSLRGGLQQLVDAMLEHLGALVRVCTDVKTVKPHEDGTWRIGFADGTSAQADALICALPAHAAARVLREADAKLAEMLEAIRYNSIATVNLAYDASDLPPLPPSPGFVVPAIENRRITAATLSTQKYPGRSPVNGVLLRAFIGGALQPELAESSDAELARIARAEFAGLLYITAEPRFALTRRWMRLLPEYAVGHKALLSALEQRASAHAGLALAGSAYHGVGIPDCIASGQAAAARLLCVNSPVQSG